MFLKKIVLSFLFIFALPAFAQLTPEQQAAKEKGIILFNQYKVADAELRVAAEAGDKDAQYYLAEYLRKKNMFINEEAFKWYESAALQGEAYSMLRLGRSGKDACAMLKTCDEGKGDVREWLRKALNIIRPTFDQGEPESIFLMYQLTMKLKYLKQSADAGHALSQYKLALFIKEGKYENFRNDESRQRRVEELMQVSSENGYPKAMLKYGDALLSEGKRSLAHQWYEKSAATGYVEALYEVGSYLSHEPEENGFGLDLVRGYGMLSLVATMDGGGGLGEYAIDKMSKVKNKMTADQIKAAKKYAAEWEATHPPLSYFPDKLSDF